MWRQPTSHSDMSAGRYYYSATDMSGEGSGPILLSNVSCNTSESQLLDCPYEAPDRYCNHSLDAKIYCVTCKYVSKHSSQYKYSYWSKP